MKLSNMANVLRAAGLTVVETPGWANRGYAGQDLREVRGVLWHHTATHRDAFTRSDAPTLNLCINGRSDLPGPLCQIVFGRNGTVYLTAAGVSNHAGQGYAPGIPSNMGNHYLIGVEMESSGIQPWDWTPDQIRVAPHLGAALERAYLGWLPENERYQGAHYEYSSGGKIDPAGWPGGMNGLRDQINAILAGGTLVSAGATTPIQEEDIMNVEQERKLDSLVTLVSALVDNVATKKDVASPGQVAFTEAALRSLVENVATKNDLSGVSAAVANAVGAKATVAEIEAAVRAGMTAGLKVDIIVGSQQ